MSYRWSQLAFLGAFCLLASACTENRNSIYREVELLPEYGKSLVLDSKQRVVTNMDIVNDSVAGQVIPKNIVCAEPSPDVAQGLSSALKSSLEASRGDIGVKGEFASATAAGVAQLGERFATIQLLRDQMYHNCEAYGNGAINATGYTIMNSRMNKAMVTLLSIEMTAGAFGRNLAEISGASKAKTGKNTETDKETDKPETGETAENVTSAPGSGAAPTPGSINPMLTSSDGGDASASSTSKGGTAGALGQIPGNRGAEVSEAIKGIHRQYINDNSFDTLLDACITSLDYARFDLTTSHQGESKDQDQAGTGEEGRRLERQKLLMEDAIRTRDTATFNRICRDGVIPEAVRIAGAESEANMEVEKVRAETEKLKAEQERLAQRINFIQICAQERTKDIPDCKKPSGSLDVRTEPSLMTAPATGGSGTGSQ